MIPNNTSVLLIYTGGTIGMIENTETGALENFNFEHLQKHVPELQNFTFRIDTYQFDPPMDSSDMDPDAWRKLVRIISDNYERYTGFVILHGTDTMAYTASALSFMLEGLNKPVILTGSQLPIGVLRTDGKENLLTSIEIATARHPGGRPFVPEVCIFFENHLMRGNRTTKINAENFNAFRSFNYPVLASAGEAIMAHRFKEYQPHKGEIERRTNGSMIAMESGTAFAYAIDKLQDRGKFFIFPQDEVYAGQVVGEHSHDNDLVINVTKSKKLTNMRASGSDDKVRLIPPIQFSLEEALEYIKEDEYVEVTPKAMRMRKVILDEIERKRANKN